MPHVDQDSWSESRHANGRLVFRRRVRNPIPSLPLPAACSDDPLTECAFRVGVKQTLIMRAGKCPTMNARRIWPVVASSPRDYEKVRQAS